MNAVQPFARCVAGEIGRQAQLAVVVELVAVDAGELVDDGLAAGGDRVRVGNMLAELARFGRQGVASRSSTFRGASRQLVVVQVGSRVGADRVVDQRDHVAFFERRVAEVVRAGDLLRIENSARPNRGCQSPTRFDARRLLGDNFLRRVGRVAVGGDVAVAGGAMLAEQFRALRFRIGCGASPARRSAECRSANRPARRPARPWPRRRRRPPDNAANARSVPL